MVRRARRPPREGAGWFHRTGRIDAPFVVPSLPSEVAFGFLGRLVPTTLRAEVRLQVHRIPPERALTLLDQARAVAAAELLSGGSEPGARPVELEREAESAQEIARRIAAREQELWRVGVSVHALGADPGRAETMRADLLRRFRAAGFRPRVPTYEAAPAAGTPDLTGTERRPPGYWHTLHTDGVAAFFPFVEESVTEPAGVLVGLLLDDVSPVFLDRWSHASHSWGVFGSTGSGKSFFTALTAVRSLWLRPELEIVILDPLGEFTGLARVLGGRVLSVADGRDGRWNPLDPSTTGGDAVEKAGRVGAILRALFPSLLDEEVAVLDTALRRLYDRSTSAPELSDLIEEVARTPGGTGRLGALLEVFRSGSLRHLDGPTTSSWSEGLTVVSLVGVPEGHLPFHLAYLLDAVYGRVRARPGPKLVILDEAHLLARDPATGAFLDRLVRHLRHFETGVMVISQNPDDFLGNDHGRSLLRNLRATFLLRLSEVSAQTAAFFQLTGAEAEWLPRARLPREAGYSEALLRFGPSHLPLALIASTPEFELLQGALGRRDDPDAPSAGVPVQP
jgi:Helicase HerA, central domain